MRSAALNAPNIFRHCGGDHRTNLETQRKKGKLPLLRPPQKEASGTQRADRRPHKGRKP